MEPFLSNLLKVDFTVKKNCTKSLKANKLSTGLPPSSFSLLAKISKKRPTCGAISLTSERVTKMENPLTPRLENRTKSLSCEVFFVPQETSVESNHFFGCAVSFSTDTHTQTVPGSLLMYCGLLKNRVLMAAASEQCVS
jgi:hypothetical protein